MAGLAIITGATGGIGNQFVKSVCRFDDIDEIWAVGRNKEKLESLKNQYPKITAVEADFSKDGVSVIAELIKKKNPDVKMLINNAGIAYMGQFEKMSVSDVERFCKINCSVPSELMSIVLPNMKEGAKIINVSSASSFQPNPYLSMYSSSKVYLKNLSRALNVELKSRGISVTCVCPGWVDTEMIPRMQNGKKVKYAGMLSAEKVVRKALKDSARGKEMSVPGFFAKYLRFYSKIMPAKIVMKQWLMMVRKYL